MPAAVRGGHGAPSGGAAVVGGARSPGAVYLAVDLDFQIDDNGAGGVDGDDDDERFPALAAHHFRQTSALAQAKTAPGAHARALMDRVDADSGSGWGSGSGREHGHGRASSSDGGAAAESFAALAASLRSHTSTEARHRHLRAWLSHQPREALVAGWACQFGFPAPFVVPRPRPKPGDQSPASGGAPHGSMRRLPSDAMSSFTAGSDAESFSGAPSFTASTASSAAHCLPFASPGGPNTPTAAFAAAALPPPLSEAPDAEGWLACTVGDWERWRSACEALAGPRPRIRAREVPAAPPAIARANAKGAPAKASRKASGKQPTHHRRRGANRGLGTFGTSF